MIKQKIKKKSTKNELKRIILIFFLQFYNVDFHPKGR